ncbi:aldose-1-epimerase [Kocuria sp. M1R5S2]|uniref:aldose-1-epimerase n=1 Tax=Kocuria rhizosphaerae TaxID=3376285 RepID=UPI00378D2F3B
MSGINTGTQRGSGGEMALPSAGMRDTPNGTAHTLAAGEYRATVFSSGAALGRLTWRGDDIAVPVPESEIPAAYEGKTLVPWPNRVADGRYTFRDRTHELPINEHMTNSALHGFGCWVDWDVVEATSNEVTFRTHVMPRYGYPFHLATEVTYRLAADLGLCVEITSTNVGASPAPYGVSSHPYLTCGLAPVDECTLTVPAEWVMTVDDRLLPTGMVPVGDANLDFRNARPVGPQQVDHAFGGLPPDEWEVMLSHPGNGLSVRLTATAAWLQIYTGDRLGRRGIAVEPMTCPPNAFNSKDDFIVLEPGDHYTLRFRIEASLLPNT